MTATSGPHDVQDNMAHAEGREMPKSTPTATSQGTTTSSEAMSATQPTTGDTHTHQNVQPTIQISPATAPENITTPSPHLTTDANTKATTPSKTIHDTNTASSAHADEPTTTTATETRCNAPIRIPYAGWTVCSCPAFVRSETYGICSGGSGSGGSGRPTVYDTRCAREGCGHVEVNHRGKPWGGI